jgi:MYXO-CTERM domain-containing protein
VVKWLTALTVTLLAPLAARAEIYYSADNLPGQGTCTDGDITWFMDPQEGRVIDVRVQDATGKNSERCEFATPQRPRGEWLGRTIYVGWKSRIDAPLSGGWNGMYQMKCHGTHTADQPLVFDMSGGRLLLSNHEAINGQETPRTVWSAPLPMNRWFSIVLKVKYSESRTEGTVQLWFNGVLQTLANGTTTHTGATWDGDGNNMHWGIYRADEVQGEGHHYIKRPRVASTFEEADPAGGSEPPPPTDASAGPADAGAEARPAVVDAAPAGEDAAGDRRDTAGGAATGGAGGSSTGGASGGPATGGAGTGGTAGNVATGGAASGGATGGRRGATGGAAPSTGGDGVPGPRGGDGGCACRLGPRGSTTGPVAPLALLGLGLLRLRRRALRQRGAQ